MIPDPPAFNDWYSSTGVLYVAVSQGESCVRLTREDAIRLLEWWDRHKGDLKTHSQNAMDNEVFNLVLEFFGNDFEKALTWFDTENLQLGNVRPLAMVLGGRAEKLLAFVKDMREEDAR